MRGETSCSDPALPVEDLDSRLHTIVAACVRAIGILGLSGKFDVLVPFAAGDWKGTVEGTETARSVTGFGDPRLRLSVNCLGAPAFQAEEFRRYVQKTIVGASVQVIVPLGQYDSAKFFNLGSNRWVVRAQAGVSHAVKRWTFEAFAGAWFFTRNPDFFGGNNLQQKPLFVAKIHVIHTFKRGWWLALDGGYGYGGRTILNDVERETRISTFRFGATFAVPIAGSHTLRFHCSKWRSVGTWAGLRCVGHILPVSLARTAVSIGS